MPTISTQTDNNAIRPGETANLTANLLLDGTDFELKVFEEQDPSLGLFKKGEGSRFVHGGKKYSCTVERERMPAPDGTI